MAAILMGVVGGQPALASPGRPDLGTPGGIGDIFRLAKGPDGTLVVVVRVDDQNRRIVRLVAPDSADYSPFNLDWVVDPGFHQAVVKDSFFVFINDLAVQSDGRILVGGNFDEVDGSAVDNFVRLDVDGTVDSGFHAGFSTYDEPEIARVNSIKIGNDGAILVGGEFNRFRFNRFGSIAFTNCGQLVKLSPEGDLLASTRFLRSDFSVPAVQSLAIDRFGRVSAAGHFEIVLTGPTSADRSGFTRFSPSLALERFYPQYDLSPGVTGFDVRIPELALLPDGKLLLGVAGDFDGRPELAGIGRLTVEGAIDPAFESPLLGGIRRYPDSLVTFPDGRSVYSYSQLQSVPEDGFYAFRMVGLLGGGVDWNFDWHPPTGPGGDSWPKRSAFDLIPLSDGSAMAFYRGFSSPLDMPISGGLSRIFRDGSVATEDDFPGIPYVGLQLRCSAIHPDGRIVVGGGLFGGGAFLEGLRANGEIDDRFDEPGPVDLAFTGRVRCLGVTRVGDVLFGGDFKVEESVSGTEVYRSLGKMLVGDGAFNHLHAEPFGPAMTGAVHSLAIQSDDRVLIGGTFELTGDFVGYSHLVRLLENGSVDPSFFPALQFPLGTLDPRVWDIDFDDQERILICGNFDKVAGENQRRFARLASNGELDETFAPDLANPIQAGQELVVAGATLLGDGKIMVFGNFKYASGATVEGLARLLEDGSLDPDYDTTPSWPFGRTPTAFFIGYESLAAQADGSVVVGRRFGDSVSTAQWTELSVLRPDGSTERLNYVDSLATGAPGFPFGNRNVASTTIQANGELLVAGEFVSDLGEPAPYSRAGFARLKNHPIYERLGTIGTGGVYWQRGGTAPEVQCVAFDLSTDSGATWTPLGQGARTGGGWELLDLSLPQEGYIRARARVVSGGTAHGAGSSTGLIESARFYKVPAYLLFRDWMFERLPNLGFQFPGALMTDADGDSRRDFEEFGMGTDPATGLSGPRPLRIEPNGLAPGGPSDFTLNIPFGSVDGFVYTRRIDGEKAGMFYSPEFSTDLFEWWPSDEPGIVIAQEKDVEAVFVQYPASVELTDRIFFRVSMFTDWLSE